ncbi:SCO3242 family prenyltransferase [Streptomyces griseoflavus]|uniref:SCO3242 family prenyltransferase n=1 Tax=Streptomyces griseoflavus TaxID=35619 RepID=UPI0037F8AB5A
MPAGTGADGGGPEAPAADPAVGAGAAAAQGRAAAPPAGGGPRAPGAGTPSHRPAAGAERSRTGRGATAGGPASGAGAAPRAPRSGRAAAWAELLRLPALFTVPGDALAGAAAAGVRPGPRTLLAIGSSLSLYAAGMALNDWADRAEDAVERPHRPIPSGRVRPAAALTAAGALTGTGLALAAAAGRPALAVATPLAATVWAYDLGLKHTPAGPAAMAAARGLDLLLGAAATAGGTRGGTRSGTRGGTRSGTRTGAWGGTRTGAWGGTRTGAWDGTRAALPSAALLGSHTLAVTTVSRRETTGGSVAAPLAALAATGVLARLAGHRRTRLPAGRRAAAAPGLPGPGPAGNPPRPGDLLAGALAAAYAATAARPCFHAALNPSPQLTQRAVGAGIRATVPLQAALAARSGATTTSLLVAALAPAGRMFARRAGMRKVSIT